MMRMFTIRMTALIVVVVASGGVTAEEPRPVGKLPHGSWHLKHENGTTVSLEVTEKGATWIGEFPDGTMTIKAPGFQLSDEGVVYGYAKEHCWATINQTQTSTTIIPFAFNAKLADDSLVISELRIFGLKEIAIKSMTGTYHKRDSTASKPSGFGKARSDE